MKKEKLAEKISELYGNVLMYGTDVARNSVSFLLDTAGVTDRMLADFYRDRNVIRVVNYHRTPDNELRTFEQHLVWYRKYFENIDKEKFKAFMAGKLTLSRPGIILSFDDGLLNNYDNAAPLLEKYGFTGWFFVSSGLADGTEYMTYRQMTDLVRRKHVLGCHTFSHHRMDRTDSPETLYHEIAEARTFLQNATDTEIDIFCWCGGEESTYTKEAADIIRQNYKWGFMTNNEPVSPATDHYQLQRTNVEARWTLHSAKLQVSGIMDRLYENKRKRVNLLTK